MPISALVITLRHTFVEPASAPARDTLLAELARDPCVELGPPLGARVPAVCETATLEEGRELFERLRGMDGVANVDVLSIHFEDEQLDVQGERR